MRRDTLQSVAAAKEAALEVLLHNARGPFRGLPRTAGWGYPEPYTRDLMIASLGILVSGHPLLVDALRRVLVSLAENQTRLGHIPSLAHDPQDCGASDTTPLFLIGLALFRRATGEAGFLEEAGLKALRWMEYQSPDDLVMVAQEPTSDWRDEQWVLGYGLYVNTLLFTALRLFGEEERAEQLKRLMNRTGERRRRGRRLHHEGLALGDRPYYALWSYKVHASQRFDLLGNSLAILAGIAAPSRARRIVSWIEAECAALRQDGSLAGELPPCFLPFTRPEDHDWRPRYQEFNRPGEYHNGGVWPFVCGFYVAALVAAGRTRLAEAKLGHLTRLVSRSRGSELTFGFNEWFRAQDGQPRGQDWQTWSAAMYLYAAAAVEQGCSPFFDAVRVKPGT